MWKIKKMERDGEFEESMLLLEAKKAAEAYLGLGSPNIC